MTTYKLTKTAKGNKFLYEVKDENGNIRSSRMSKRDNYIACTITGEFYFSRKELIGKGAHGQMLKLIESERKRGEEEWANLRMQGMQIAYL